MCAKKRLSNAIVTLDTWLSTKNHNVEASTIALVLIWQLKGALSAKQIFAMKTIIHDYTCNGSNAISND